MLGVLLLGFLIGLQHAMEADHVAAVASLATQNRTLAQTARQGVVWGLGHALTLFLFAGVVLVFDLAMPESLARTLELAVGVMLILLGVDVLRRLISERVHFHAHSHGELTHFHAHSHQGGGAHDADLHLHKHAERFPLRALFVGMMHGMAGSAALILLALETVVSPLEGLLYILVFGFGSIAGMGLLALVISLPLRLSSRSLTWAHNGLKGVVGFLTVGLGAAVIVSVI
ncbi:MAG: urease accessory protein [gamma proteobacterium endosymbiont of Lamellibrachia anaximandri]|nr:urease accessory protein [gamma proteobacterium endosymbiont of Lamellibrachia anaximandri]MBL3619469.1 urease accessory protein [gamma proteobacterium endosymbiont of Lamellibrachia anaximandri]